MSERPPDTEPEIVELVRSIDVQAPQELHRRVEALVAERGGRASTHRRRQGAIRWGLSGAVALAAVVAVLVVSLSGGAGSALTLHTAVALTMRPATMAAPAQDPHNEAELAADVEGVAFPYWDDRFGWRATGARTDRVDGRAVTTVFYARAHQWIGYAIVAGAPAPHVGGGVVRERSGTSYRFLTEDGASVVTWLRDGHLCVVAGHGVNDATLMALASWHEHGMLSA
ncbi:MAG: hypothetical protein ACLPUT_12270 [Solirubrobacteraceae bacterium]|jgi:hypothetical protein